MSGEVLGASYALLTAVAWAVGVLLYKRTGETWSPLALNMFKNVLALGLLASTFVVLGADLWPSPAWLDVAMLLASGAAGLGLADSLFLKALALLGAGRTALIETIYAPTVVFVSAILLDERLSPQLLAGALFVVGGVALVNSRYGGGTTDGQALTRAELIRGVSYGVTAMVVVALAIVSVKRVIERHDVLWVTLVRVAGGVAALAVAALFSAELRRDMAQTFRPQRAWRFAVPGTVIGMYISLLSWTGGFKYASASVAAVLNQTSSIMVVVLAAVFLREPLTRGRLAAVALAFAGSVLVFVQRA